MKQLDLFENASAEEMIEALMAETGETRFDVRCALEDHHWDYDRAYLELVR